MVVVVVVVVVVKHSGCGVTMVALTCRQRAACTDAPDCREHCHVVAVVVMVVVVVVVVVVIVVEVVALVLG